MRHIMTAAALVCVLALSGACGDDEGADDDTPPAQSASATPSVDATPEVSPSDEATPEPEPEGTVIEVTLQDGEVTPSGDRVQAKVGEPITFVITADVPGELHVHSAEGPEIEFGAGTSEHEVTIDQPGVVEVELHEPELIVVQLEVS